MSAVHDDELPTLDTADLARVTGGADDFASMLPLMLIMMRNRAQAAMAAAPPPAAVPPWQPKITVDGVPVQLTQNGTGTFTSSSG
jgi:hypothetical protein